MFVPLGLTLTLLLAGGSTLPNGIRVYEIPAAGSDSHTFEVIAGYRTGVRNETKGTGGLAAVVSTFLKSSPSARAMAVAAYGAGGEIEFFSDLDRTGLRLKMPDWARPMVEESIAEFLSETPQKNPELVDRALDEVRARIPASPPDVRSRVEDQFRIALLGPESKSDLTAVRRYNVEQFFARNYGTDRAFIAMTGAPPLSLQAVERRPSDVAEVINVDTEIVPKPSLAPRIESELQEGAVLLGTPVPSIYYRNWYAFLMMDRLISQAISEKPITALFPALEPYYYRMEVPVPVGERAETVEKAVIQELSQMQYVRASSEQLEAARRSAIQYLESEAVQRWFVTLGIPERRQEGLEWVRQFTADDMRVTARNIVDSKLVVASWSPRARVIRLDTQTLSDLAARPELLPAKSLPPLSPVRLTAFPPHRDAEFKEQPPVRLGSGVSVVASSAYAVFVAPDSLKVFEREPGPDEIQSAYGSFWPERILVMAPAESLNRVDQQWARFQGNPRDQTSPSISGNITSADLPALFVLEMMLDRRLIEAGLWSDVQLQIHAAGGSTLAIHGNDTNRRLVLEWIRQIASQPIPVEEINWAREAAIHHMATARPDLQSLAWMWNPDAALADIRTIPASQIQEVAGIYIK